MPPRLMLRERAPTGPIRGDSRLTYWRSGLRALLRLSIDTYRKINFPINSQVFENSLAGTGASIRVFPHWPPMKYRNCKLAMHVAERFSFGSARAARTRCRPTISKVPLESWVSILAHAVGLPISCGHLPSFLERRPNAANGRVAPVNHLF